MARKAKAYPGRVYLGQDENGRQLWHWVGRFEKKRDRDNAVALAKAEKPWLDEAAPDEWTVDAWADRYLARMESGDLRTRGGRRYKHSSIDTARTALKHLRREFGDRPLSSITRVEAENWAAKVPNGVVAVAVTLMERAYEAEELDRNRFKGLSQRTEGRKNERPPSEEEMVLLLEACSALSDDYAPMMRALVTFAPTSLMRPCELFDLDWERDIDLSAGQIGRARIQSRRLPEPQRHTEIEQGADHHLHAADAAGARLAACDPRLLPHRVRVPQQDRGPAHRATLTAYWKEVRARSRVDRVFYSCTKHYGVWFMKVREPAGCRHRRPGGLVGAVRHEDGRNLRPRHGRPAT